MINGQTGSYHRDAFDRLINVHTGFLLCELLVFVGSDLRMLRKHKNVYILSSTIFVQPEHTERFYYSCSVLRLPDNGHLQHGHCDLLEVDINVLEVLWLTRFVEWYSVLLSGYSAMVQVNFINLRFTV